MKIVRVGRTLVWVSIVVMLLSATSYAQLREASPEGGGEAAAENQGGQADQPSPDGEGTEGAPAGKPKKRGLFEGPGLMIVMLGGFVLLYIWMGRSKRKEAAKRKEMLASLKKGDKVTSVGGVIGTVVEVKEDEVTVKVDETNNIRMHFAKWAVRGVGEQAKTEGPEDRK